MSNSPKFLLDENIPRAVKRFLESERFSAEYTSKGITNGKLASLSIETESVLVSRDSDFLNRSMFPPKKFFGIIVFVIHPPRPKKLVEALSSLLTDVSEFKSKLFVVDEEGFEVVD
jgi:predicted nuclease of predicted toxin-antitoxin system